MALPQQTTSYLPGPLRPVTWKILPSFLHFWEVKRLTVLKLTPRASSRGVRRGDPGMWRELPKGPETIANPLFLEQTSLPLGSAPLSIPPIGIPWPAVWLESSFQTLLFLSLSDGPIFLPATPISSFLHVSTQASLFPRVLHPFIFSLFFGLSKPSLLSLLCPFFPVHFICCRVI